MKLWLKLVAAFLLSPSFPVAADNPADNPANNLNNLTIQAPNPNSDNTPTDDNKLTKYFLIFGHYLGYDLTKDPLKAHPPLQLVRTLINLKNTEAIDAFLSGNLAGSIPVNSFLPKFLPEGVTVPDASILNPLANTTFKNYSSASASGQKITANPLIDQANLKDQKFQNDPINQTIFNILGTPDNSFCGGNITLTQDMMDKCNFLSPLKITNNVIGVLPSPTADDATEAFYSPAYLESLMGQLNSSALLAPLRYDTSYNLPGAKLKNGVSATNQATQAANFIRYASGTIIPPKAVNFQDYSNLYSDATSTPNASDQAGVNQKFRAQTTLNSYFANMRIFAARTSVGVGNLYYILSKRMEQQIGSISTSQTQNEFTMATKRLNLEKTQTDSWLEQIDKASPDTVQKEIAVLLAEINYQLYLNRQQEERMLLTQSILLLQLLQPPDSNLGAATPPAALQPTPQT